jgi:hypothetical protein
MKIEQLYTDCLAKTVYHIKCNSKAVIIDSLHKAKAYQELEKNNNTCIKYIVETYSYADFMFGQLNITNKTGRLKILATA